MNDANKASTVSQPPLLRISERLHVALGTLEDRVGETISATQRLADRLVGESSATTTTGSERPIADMGPSTGLGGQMGEIESAVLRAEGLINDMAKRAEAAVNRLTAVV